MSETQTNPKCDADADSGPKFFDVVLYRSGFDDITIRLAAKDSAQACHKAIKAYGSWNVVRVRNVKENPQPETLAALINQALGGTHDLAEVVTRAYNAGYEDHTADVQGQPTFCNRCDIKVDQEGFNEWADKVEPTPADPEIGMTEEPEEANQWRIQRDADKASVIDLILHYKNPADDEKRMRQIRVVMD